MRERNRQLLLNIECMCKPISKKLKQMNNEDDSYGEEEDQENKNDFIRDFVILNTNLDTKDCKQFALHFSTNNKVKFYKTRAQDEKTAFKKQSKSINTLAVFQDDVPNKYLVIHNTYAIGKS